jgi:parallel beta-helix repeat protein
MHCPVLLHHIALCALLAVVSTAAFVRAATFSVTNANPSGAGSLAQAITSANVDSTPDMIEFDIAGGGVPTIVASLPAITQPVTIDGTTQTAGFVEVQNGGATALTINGSGSTVMGMVFNSSITGVAFGAAAGGNTITGCRIGTDPTGTAAAANQTGVFVQGPSGGDNAITNNLISGNTQSGINIQGADTVVTGNIIGLDVTGMAKIGGGTGIIINSASGTRVGGTQAGEGNVIAGIGTGISLQNATVQGTLIQGNRIGTNAANATGLGPSTGIGVASVTGVGNVIGGAQAGAGNLIVAGSSLGMSVVNSSGVTIQGNTIGTAALPNTSHGIDMVGADGNTIEDNTISGNGGAGLNFRSGADDNTIRGNTITGNGGIGIAVSGGQRDRFTENGIHANGSLGIDLGVNGVDVNDPLDADVAPGHNDKQNYPELSPPSSTQVMGTLHSTPSTMFTVEIFGSPSCDASGNGEGETFLGAVDVMTDAAGDADVTLGLPPAAAGKVLTATATAPNGNTSELSACTGPVPGGSTTSTTPTTSTSTTSSSTSTSTSTVATTTAPPSTLATTTTLPTSSTTSSTTSTSTTSTASTSSSTSSSSSAPVTTTTRASTTSTTLGDPCVAEPVGPAFRSINCRLAAALAQVSTASDLGSYQDKLRRLLERAKAKKEEAEGLCLEPDLRHAKKRIQQSGRWADKVGRTLRTVRARKTLPPARRTDLLAVADGIRADLRTLGGRVRCPDDAR